MLKFLLLEPQFQPGSIPLIEGAQSISHTNVHDRPLRSNDLYICVEACAQHCSELQDCGLKFPARMMSHPLEVGYLLGGEF